jgi:hypothetical protein
VLKSDADRDLLEAVEAVARKRHFFTTRLSELVLGGYLAGPAAKDKMKSKVPQLNERECEVVGCWPTVCRAKRRRHGCKSAYELWSRTGSISAGNWVSTRSRNWCTMRFDIELLRGQKEAKTSRPFGRDGSLLLSASYDDDRERARDRSGTKLKFFRCCVGVLPVLRGDEVGPGVLRTCNHRSRARLRLYQLQGDISTR